MNDLPPLLRDQRKIDKDHLKLISIFYFVCGGLAVIGIGFIFLHYLMMTSMMSQPGIVKTQNGKSIDPEQFMAVFKWFYFAFGTMLVGGSLMNIAAGIFIKKRKYYIGTLIIAGITCLQFPFGTALGVFTFVVLLRESVKEIYLQKLSSEDNK